MNGYESGLVLAVGLAHLAAVVSLIYFRLSWRFLCLTTHLVTEGIFQLIDYGLIGDPARDLIWACGQAPRLLIRGAVVWEVWHECSIDFDPVEGKGLKMIGWLCCLLAGCIAVFVMLMFPAVAESQAKSVFTILMLVRQYLLLGFTVWLVLLNLYLLWTRTITDHNLMLYRVFATFGSAVIFTASSFVRGGLGYHLFPWDNATWSMVHVWQCWYMLILIGVLALFLKSESSEAS